MTTHTGRCRVMSGAFAALVLMAGCAGRQEPRLSGDSSEASRAPATETTSSTFAPRVTVDQFDVFGPARAECRAMYEKGLYERALDCCQTLWTESGKELSQGGQIELLQLMGQIYCASQNFPEAEACYYRILQIDRYWLPRDFDSYPTDWREPIITAYRKHGYTQGRRPGVRNIALLDFEIGDATPGKIDLTRLDKALADYVSATLERELGGGPATEASINFVSARERMRLIEETAMDWQVDPTGPVHADQVDRSAVVAAGRKQAVQGFLQGSIMRVNDTITVAFLFIDVETGINDCGYTQQGEVDDLIAVVDRTLAGCLACLSSDAADDGEQQQKPAPMQAAVDALVNYHEALIEFEQGRLEVAKVLAQSAVELLPSAPEFKELLDRIAFAAETMTLARAVDLPEPSLN